MGFAPNITTCFTAKRKTTEMPKVSICIPAYKNPDGIKRLLESVFSQLYTDYEVIVSDDTPDDSVKCAIDQVPAAAGTVRYYKSGSSDGAASNWNRAVSYAEGEYIKIMHHDDWFTDERSLGELVKLLDDAPDADLAFSGTRQVNAVNMQFIKDRSISEADEDLIRSDWRNLYLGNTIGAPSASLVRRSAADRINLAYDKNLTWLVDEDYYMQLLSNGSKFVRTREPLISIGLSDEQLTEKVRDAEDLNISEQIYIFRKYHLADHETLKSGSATVSADDSISGDKNNQADDSGSLHGYSDYLLKSLAENHLPASELPKDLGIDDIEVRYRKAVNDEKIAEKERKSDTRQYLASKAWRIIDDPIDRVEERLGKIVDRIEDKLAPVRAKLQKPGEIAFWLGLTIELILVIWDKSNSIVPYTGWFFRVTFVLFFIKVLSERLPKPELALFIFAAILGVIDWRISGKNEILRAVVMIAAFRGEDLTRTLKYIFRVTLAGCLLLALLAVTGVFGDVYLIQNFDGTGEDLRYCFGMGNPNAMMCMAAMLIILGLYIWDSRMKWYSYVLLAVFDVVLYGLGKSIAAAGVIALALLMSATFHYSKQIRECDMAYRITGIIFAAALVFLVAAAAFGNQIPIIAWLDSHVMTGRVASLWDSTFYEGTLATWRWFSSRDSGNYFDLGWLRLIYWYGVVPALFIIMFVYEWLRSIRLRRDHASYMMVSCLVLYTVIEAHLVSIYLGRSIELPLLAAYIPYILGEKSCMSWRKE